MRWTDDHCHLDEDPGVAATQVAEAADAGVERLITVGCELAQSLAYLRIARSLPGVVFATAGVHPHDALAAVAADALPGIEALLAEPEVVAVGECGLDFHYDHSPRDVQRDVFVAQIAMAHRHDRTLVIHTREAWAETFAALATEGVPARTVFHCFTGGPEEARRCLDLGAWLSFSGIASFPSAADVRAAAVLCPPDRLLVETDSPYLAPVPHRGRRNRPAWVPAVGAALAAARDEAVEAIAEVTWANATHAYRLDQDR
jgi:TatD DNase family protein